MGPVGLAIGFAILVSAVIGTIVLLLVWGIASIWTTISNPYTGLPGISVFLCYLIPFVVSMVLAI